MASAAEQMAGSMNLAGSRRRPSLGSASGSPWGADRLPDRHLHPGAGVDAAVMGSLMNQSGGGILGMFDMLVAARWGG